MRVDGQKSAYVPIMKQGGDTNTIDVVNGVRDLIPQLVDIPKQLVASVVFDQSVYVKEALRTVGHEGLIGLALTSLMILIFLGSVRATSAVLLSIPLSALTTFVILSLMGSTINTMILGGLALAFSRVIDNSVISLENIYRHLEMGVRARRWRRKWAARRSTWPFWPPRWWTWWTFSRSPCSTASASFFSPPWPWRSAWRCWRPSWWR